MAPKTAEDDFQFIMTCIKHTSSLAKPDFDEVAKELGAKNSNACYHRHWAIMKKWGLAGGGIGKARRAGAVGASGVTKKTVKPASRKPKAGTPPASAGDDDDGSGSGDNEEVTRSAAKKPGRAPKKNPVVKTEDSEDTEGDTASAATIKSEDDENESLSVKRSTVE